jgi:hypothetical protein
MLMEEVGGRRKGGREGGIIMGSREEEGGREGGIGIRLGSGEGRLSRPSSPWMGRGASLAEGVREEEEEGQVVMVLLLPLVRVLRCVVLVLAQRLVAVLSPPHVVALLPLLPSPVPRAPLPPPTTREDVPPLTPTILPPPPTPTPPPAAAAVAGLALSARDGATPARAPSVAPTMSSCSSSSSSGINPSSTSGSSSSVSAAIPVLTLLAVREGTWVGGGRRCASSRREEGCLMVG